jgi:hypothetical protein
MENNKCDLFITTYDYGKIESEDDLFTNGINTLEDLHLEAINRNINISYPFHVICTSIQNEFPSLEWQKQNMLYMSDRDLVSEEELESVRSYGSYSFTTMNGILRKYPDREALLNVTIDKMNPLDKDIVVFRYIKLFNFLPLTIGETFDSYGYLSTSISAAGITGAACSYKKVAVMRIHVPKGKKCIYLPGSEKELLFSHGISLQLLNIQHNNFYCFKKDKFSTDNNIVLYDFIML